MIATTEVLKLYSQGKDVNARKGTLRISAELVRKLGGEEQVLNILIFKKGEPMPSPEEIIAALEQMEEINELADKLLRMKEELE